MYEMTDDEFEAAVQDALDSIPAQFQEELDNIVFMIADEPQEDDFKHCGLCSGTGELFGLYEGLPLDERADGYGYGDAPDIITIFKGPHERASSGRDELIEEVRRTVVHEIAHYFGMDEAQVDEMGYA